MSSGPTGGGSHVSGSGWGLKIGVSAVVALVGAGAPLFHGENIVAFVVNRAHHADIGAHVPGSMPVSSSLDEEGLVLEPVHLVRGGEWQAEVLDRIESATADPASSRGDFAAQVSANRAGLARLEGLVERAGRRAFGEGLRELNDYGERLARAVLREIPDGIWTFEDRLDDVAQGVVHDPGHELRR